MNNFHTAVWFQITDDDNPKQKIEQFYSTYKWDPNTYYHFGKSGHGSNGNERVLHIPQTPRLKPHHQMLFNVILRTLTGFKYYYLTPIILFNIIHSFDHI